MKQQVSPKLFFAVVALICLVVGTILYRQATDPLYHVEPDEEAARQQFSKPAPAPSAPAKNAASKPESKTQSTPGNTAPSSLGP